MCLVKYKLSVLISQLSIIISGPAVLNACFYVDSTMFSLINNFDIICVHTMNDYVFFFVNGVPFIYMYLL